MAATLITGANVWDGMSAQAAPGQVLVVDRRIQQLADGIEAPPDTRVVDLSGHTLTPGFMHRQDLEGVTEAASPADERVHHGA
jgi:imidazolonepropionase-like amidohydrolase